MHALRKFCCWETIDMIDDAAEMTDEPSVPCTISHGPEEGRTSTITTEVKDPEHGVLKTPGGDQDDIDFLTTSGKCNTVNRLWWAEVQGTNDC